MLEPKRPLRIRAADERPAGTRPFPDVISLRVVLLEIVPPVWRLLRLPAQFTLRQLHGVLRCAMGGYAGEAHRFRVGEEVYGITSDRSKPRDSRWVTLADVARLGVGSFRYEISGHEDWEHEVLIEEIQDGTAENQRPVCLDGERAWPPENGAAPDTGVDFLGFASADPAGFDLDAVNRALSRLR